MNRYVEPNMDAQYLAELVLDYEVSSQIPDVSGAEHLDMLLIRSELERQKQRLAENQLQRLHKADICLRQHLHEFYEAISRIVDLAIWRQDEDAPPSHWWWYLDVLAHAQINSQLSKRVPIDSLIYLTEGQLQPA